MSTTTEQTPETTIRIDPVPGRGRRRVRVAIMHGETPVHLDTFEIDNAGKRAAFIKAVDNRAECLGITLNRDSVERALLQDAMQDHPTGAANVAEQPDSGEVLQAFGIDVLGETDNQSIVCWIPATGKRWQVKSPANWKIEEMFQAMGRRALNGLWREQGRPPEGRYRPEALREAVAIAAATAPRLTASRFVGQGAGSTPPSLRNFTSNLHSACWWGREFVGRTGEYGRRTVSGRGPLRRLSVRAAHCGDPGAVPRRRRELLGRRWGGAVKAMSGNVMPAAWTRFSYRANNSARMSPIRCGSPSTCRFSMLGIRFSMIFPSQTLLIIPNTIRLSTIAGSDYFAAR